MSSVSRTTMYNSNCFNWDDTAQPVDARIKVNSGQSSSTDDKTEDIIVKDGERFTVNRHLLTANSDYFRYLFSSSERRVPSPIVLNEVTSNGFRALLALAQETKFHITMDNVEDLLIVSQYLIIPRIVNVCTQYLFTQIKEHWLKILDLVNKYSLFVVGFEVHNFLLHNFETISTDVDQFGQIPYEVLFSLAQDPRINISSEFKLFKIVLKWINYKFEERADYFDCFLTVIRLPLMSPDELEEVAMYFNPLVYSPGQEMVNFLLNEVTS